MKRVLFIFLPLLLLFFFLLGFFFLKSDFFLLKYLDCRIDGQVCSPQEEKGFLSLMGKNIFFINPDDLAKKAMESNPLLKEVQIKQSLPNKLKIVLYKRELCGQVTLDFANYYYFDESGILFQKGEKNGAKPLLRLYEAFPINLGIHYEQFSKLAKLFDLLSKYELRLSDFFLQNNTLLDAYMGEGSVITFSLDKDLEKQVASLQLILSRSKIEGKEIKSLDLRFAKPVAIFK